MRIKATSHLVTLNHFDTDLGILKRQQALAKLPPAALLQSLIRERTRTINAGKTSEIWMHLRFSPVSVDSRLRGRASRTPNEPQAAKFSADPSAGQCHLERVAAIPIRDSHEV